MIRHRPWGTGHAYQRDVDQRFPVHPVAGEPFVVGARGSGDVTAVTAEVEVTRDGVRTVETLSAARVDAGALADLGATAAGEGHLAAAQATTATAGTGWSVRLLAEAGATYRYRFVASRPSGAERTRWFTVAASRWLDGTPVAQVPADAGRVVPGSQQYLTDGERVWAVRLALALAPAERVVGFGERFERVDQTGRTLDAQVFEQYTNQGAMERTYLPMPFAHVVGGDGWGFHVRTAGRTWFDVGASRADRLAVEVELDVPATGEPFVECAVYRGTPGEVLDAFLAEAGRPTELPAWVFRLWASSNEWNTQAEVLRQAELHRRHGIPVGALVVEAWSDETSFTAFRDAEYQVREDGSPQVLSDFTFPADGAWPDPVAMADELRAQDVHLVLWQIPLVKMHRPEATGQVLAQARAAVRDGVVMRVRGSDGVLRPYRNRGWWFHGGLMPDLSDERSARWWTERRRYLVEEVGVDGFKTDGGEHAWGGDLVYVDGENGTTRNNTFGVHYAKAYGDLLASAGKAPVTFSRSGFVGSQAHGAFWAGDERSTWEAFRWSMIAGLNASACGILYWGWDIAGFSGPVPEPELYLRAFAASVFLPIAQYHSEYNFHRLPSNDRTPWNIAERHAQPGVLDGVRELVAVRERLVPYLVEQARASIAGGLPLMRPLWFTAPDDPGVWRHPLQWTLGADLLVAPVVDQGATTWRVHLPAGEWVDAWTGASHGPGTVDADVSDPVRVPVFVRSSAWPRLAGAFSG